MNIHYITRMNLSSSKAHVYNTAKTCEALNDEENFNLILISTDSTLRTKEDKQAYFERNGVTKSFSVVSLHSWSNYFSKSKFRLVNYLEIIFINITLTRYIITNSSKIDCVYFRDPLTPLPLLVAKYIFNKPLFFEIHAVLVRKSTQKIAEYLARISNGIINISYGLDEFYKPINKNSIVSFCAASEPERFRNILTSKLELRKELNLPVEKVISVYTGNLYRTGNNDSYGIEDIIAALPLLDPKYIFVGVGKKENETADLESLSRKLGVADRVIFVPWVAKDIVTKYLLAADILLVPASGDRIGNSPTKMFEYLVSGRPIVAARTRAIEEILKDKQNALLVEYSNPQSWADALMLISRDTIFASHLVLQAEKDGKLLTWEQRARDISGFISKTLHL